MVGIYLFLPNYYITLENNTRDIFLKIKKVEKPKKPKKINKGKIIVIDPGHGGKDSGAVGYKKLEEKKVVLSVAKKVKNILKKRGFKVYLTRSRDKFIPLKKRTRFANLKNANFFISIHANAVAGRKKRYRSCWDRYRFSCYKKSTSS